MTRSDRERGFDFTWVEAGGGRLALWHRPKLRALPHLASAGCDRVASVLGVGEGAPELGRAIEGAGLDWSWIPLESGRPPEGRGRRDRIAREGVAELAARLAAGESVLVHCSAGMHRTGMLAYALLRSLGLRADESLALVERMRLVTANALAPAHLAWGDGLASQG